MDRSAAGGAQAMAQRPAGATAPQRITHDDTARACRSLIGQAPFAVHYPGGLKRSSVRAVCERGPVIVTRRKHANRAALEAGVQRELHAAGAPVPAVLAFDGEWLIQEDLGDHRLPALLQDASLPVVGARLDAAASALLRCQQAATTLSLAQRVAPIGLKPEWLASVLAMPTRIAARLDLADPRAADAVDPAQLLPRRLAFVKWDARPGNALLVAPDAAAWIDWEHCGARDALDDLAWLLCDEYVPDDAGLEAALLRRHLPAFAQLSGRTPDDALAYLSRFGSLHSCMRLWLVLENKGDGAWWDAAACARTDRVGVTDQAARRLCTRGARWAARWPGGERMRLFFVAVGERLREPAADSSALLAAAALVPGKNPAAHPASQTSVEI